MKKKFLLTTMAAALLASYPLGASAQEIVAASKVETQAEATEQTKEASKKEQAITVQTFLDHAVTALTYQHASKEMQEAIIKNWLGDQTLDGQSLITKGDVAKILVRHHGLEKDEKTKEDYLKTAQLHRLLPIQHQADDKVTEQEMKEILADSKAFAQKDITDEGVKEISVEDFMKDPGQAGYQLSPDGQYISYLDVWEKRSNVFVKKMEGDDEPVRVTSIKDRDISSYFWKDDKILYLKDDGGDENFQLYMSSFNEQKERNLTPYPGVRVEVLSMLEDVNDEILIAMNKEDPKVFDVYKLNIVTGELQHVLKNPGNIAGWLADHDGNIRMAIQTDGVETTVLHRASDKDEFKPFIEAKNGDTISPIAFSKDNQTIYALSNIGRDKTAVVTYDLDGKEKLLFSHPQVDVMGSWYSPTKDKLIAATFITDKIEFKFFDEELEAIFNDLKKQLGVSKHELFFAEYDKEYKKFIVTVTNDKNYGSYYYYDATTKELTKLTDLAPWLDKEQLADMHPISYKSRDGLTIHGYLTLPKNKKPENLPLIVNPHGGPWARDIWGFNPEVQLLANRGYAVLQVNFRSSTGYGKEFVDAGNKQWGLKIQDDITDGVQWAIDQGIADPDRIGIYGASFGGYATLAGITFTPDLYAAAVDYVGVSNIFTLLETIPPYWEPVRNDFYRRVGHPEKDKELLESVSPVFHVDKIKTPLFVAQGAKDPRVNKAESDQIVEALRKRGVDVQYMVKENEGHGFMNEENKIEFYKAMLEFLDQHLKK